MNLQMLDLSDSDIGNVGLRYLTGRLLTFWTLVFYSRLFCGYFNLREECPWLTSLKISDSEEKLGPTMLMHQRPQYFWEWWPFIKEKHSGLFQNLFRPALTCYYCGDDARVEEVRDLEPFLHRGGHG